MVAFCTRFFCFLLASNTCMYVHECGGVSRVFATPSSAVAAPAVRSQPCVRCCCCCRWQSPLPRVPWPSLSATPAGRTGACPGSTAACTENKNERAEQRPTTTTGQGEVEVFVCGTGRESRSSYCPNFGTKKQNKKEIYAGFEELGRLAQGIRIRIVFCCGKHVLAIHIIEIEQA